MRLPEAGVGERVLVTGAAGFVGAAVVRRLANDGREVVAAVGPASDTARLRALGADLRVERADLRDAAALDALVARVRPDTCVHCAAAGVTGGGASPEDLLAVNAAAAPRLAAALARGGGRRLVSAGSSFEYGADGSLPSEPYGAAKLAGGVLAHLAGRTFQVETLHLRLFQAYGPGEDDRRLVAAVARALLAGTAIELTPGDQVRDFVFVADAADALVAGLDAPGVTGATLDVGSGEPARVRDACLLLAELAGADARLLRFGARTHRPHERFAGHADARTTAATLGWRARTSLPEGFRAVLADPALSPRRAPG